MNLLHNVMVDCLVERVVLETALEIRDCLGIHLTVGLRRHYPGIVTGGGRPGPRLPTRTQLARMFSPPVIVIVIVTRHRKG